MRFFVRNWKDKERATSTRSHEAFADEVDGGKVANPGDGQPVSADAARTGKAWEACLVLVAKVLPRLAKLEGRVSDLDARYVDARVRRLAADHAADHARHDEDDIRQRLRRWQRHTAVRPWLLAVGYPLMIAVEWMTFSSAIALAFDMDDTTLLAKLLGAFTLTPIALGHLAGHHFGLGWHRRHDDAVDPAPARDHLKLGLLVSGLLAGSVYGMATVRQAAHSQLADPSVLLGGRSPGGASLFTLCLLAAAPAFFSMVVSFVRATPRGIELRAAQRMHRRSAFVARRAEKRTARTRQALTSVLGQRNGIAGKTLAVCQLQLEAAVTDINTVRARLASVFGASAITAALPSAAGVRLGLLDEVEVQDHLDQLDQRSEERLAERYRLHPGCDCTLDTAVPAIPREDRRDADEPTPVGPSGPPSGVVDLVTEPLSTAHSNGHSEEALS